MDQATVLGADFKSADDIPTIVPEGSTPSRPAWFIKYINERVIKMILIKCKICKKEYEINVQPEQIEEWRNGKYIQHAMPNLTAGERELFISGFCDICWQKMFSEEE